MNSEVRVRIAPSPTGFFHVGTARTALYNWLFARHNKGKFILRIEDTDVARSSKEMTQVILDGLNWLGLNWDEGPFLQSERISIYQGYVKKLIDQGSAYYCYCQPEDLEKEKKDAYKNKIDWKYDRRCLNLSTADREEKERQKIPKAVRFLIPNHAVLFKDLVHGAIKREAENIEDFVIMRPDNMPTYNFACVVDDYEMKISHVIRGVDHITNTPKQILLYEALGTPQPEFAHLPLILGSDKKRLSKRHGAVSLMSYQDQGFLPEAIVNFLSLLGWAPGNDKEIMKVNEIIELFVLDRINSANAVFDIEKLQWMNLQYIMSFTDEELLEHLKPYITTSGLMKPDEVDHKKEWLLKICGLMKPRLHVLSDIKNGSFFFTDNFTYDETALNKYQNERTLKIMGDFLSVLEKISDFNTPILEESLRSFANAQNLKAKDIIHPLRVFVTGTEKGPGLFETLELLGKETCLQRIKMVIAGHGRTNG